jgi:predicted Na+-dependent transporter
VLRSKATGEAPVCPRLIDAVVSVVGATVMSDPLIVIGVNVRNVRMTFLVHCNVVLDRRIGLLLTACRPSRPGSGRWSRTASGNVSTANCLVTAAV